MTNAEISELGIKLFNENKIDEWTDAIAADDIALGMWP